MMLIVWPKMSSMQEVVNRVPRGDRVIVIGDFNAKVGKNMEV